jgi:hypothetical protein
VSTVPSKQTDGGVVDDPPREQLAAVLVERRHVRPLAMQVDPDRIHRWASFVSDFILGLLDLEPDPAA